MPAPVPAGLADSNRSEERVESASPETTLSDKSCCSDSAISLDSDSSPSSLVTYNVLEADRPPQNLTYPPRSGTGESGSPADAVRRRALEERGRATQRKPARNAGRAPRGPRTDSTSRPRGLPRATEARPSGGDPPEAPPSRAVRCGLHLTLVRTTQERLYLPVTPRAGRRPEAREAAPLGAPSHPADDRRGSP